MGRFHDDVCFRAVNCECIPDAPDVFVFFIYSSNVLGVLVIKHGLNLRIGFILFHIISLYVFDCTYI